MGSERTRARARVPSTAPGCGRGPARRSAFPLESYRARSDRRGAAWSRRLAQSLRPPVVDPALVVPDATQMGQDFTGEAVAVLEGQFVRHRADLQEHHEVTHAEAVDHLLLQPISHSGWTAGAHK